jgi:hypothetical protein
LGVIFFGLSFRASEESNLPDGVEKYATESYCYTVDTRVGRALRRSQAPSRGHLVGPVYFDIEPLGDDDFEPFTFRIDRVWDGNGPPTGIVDAERCALRHEGNHVYSVQDTSIDLCYPRVTPRTTEFYLPRAGTDISVGNRCTTESGYGCSARATYKDVSVKILLQANHRSEILNLEGILHDVLSEKFEFFPACEGL